MIDGRNYDANLNVFGQPMQPAPQARFSQGGEIELDVVLTAHHKGHFEFSACPIEPGGVATAACFDRYPLTFISDPLYDAPRDINYPKRAYIAPLTRALPDNSGGLPGVFYRFRFKLPNDLSGELVLLQWHYYTANSCTYPGYSSYLFPSSWGPMQDNLSLCTNIPPDGNGVPGTWHLMICVFYSFNNFQPLLNFLNLQNNFGIALKSQLAMVRFLHRHLLQFLHPLRPFLFQLTHQFPHKRQSNLRLRPPYLLLQAQLVVEDQEETVSVTIHFCAVHSGATVERGLPIVVHLHQYLRLLRRHL
jgi:Lytic polysaccharide mono-oxygenase, cellulose-degrading